MLCPFIQHDFILILSLNLMWMYGGQSDINDGGKGGISVDATLTFYPFKRQVRREVEAHHMPYGLLILLPPASEMKHEALLCFPR